jgi:hypothetical protein
VCNEIENECESDYGGWKYFHPEDYPYEDWLHYALNDAWWSVAVGNFLIFIIRSIRYVLVAILKRDHTASMVGVYFVLGVFWMVEGLILLAYSSELNHIKRYMAIIKKFNDVDISWSSHTRNLGEVVVVQQILFPVIRLYWFHNIYYKSMTVNWKEYRELRDEL